MSTLKSMPCLPRQWGIWDRKRIAAIVFLLIVASGISKAAQWAETSIGSDGTITYIDFSSLYQTNEGYIGYWEKRLFKNKQHIQGKDYFIKGKKVWYSLYLAVADCRNSLVGMTPVQYANYGLSGEVLSSGSFGNPDMERPIPDSVGEISFQLVCGVWDAKQRQNN